MDIPVNYNYLITMKIIDKIQEIQSVKNISQEYMAIILGRNTFNYHRLEKGVSPLSIDRLEAIAAALGVQLPELITYGEPAKNTALDVHPFYLDHLEKKVYFLRKQQQIKENQLSAFLFKRSENDSPEQSFKTGRRG